MKILTSYYNKWKYGHGMFAVMVTRSDQGRTSSYITTHSLSASIVTCYQKGGKLSEFVLLSLKLDFTMYIRLMCKLGVAQNCKGRVYT